MVRLGKPTVLSCLNSLKMLTDPEEFIRGRRDCLGKKANRLSDEEILPGWCVSQAEIYVSEADLSQVGEWLEEGKELAA